MTEQPFVDGVSPAVPPSSQVEASPAEQPIIRPLVKTTILFVSAIPYAMYAIWCLFLLASFPVMGGSKTVIMMGVLTTSVGAILFLLLGGFGFMRVSTSKAHPRIKMNALLKLGAFVLPGLLLSLITPFSIIREPALTITIVSPVSSAQFIAPLSIEFSVNEAVNVLAERGFAPVQYAWDINADKKVDQQTLTPSLTATFDREGIYIVSVTMKNSNGATKVASRRFIISQSVFSVNPLPAVKDQPVVFSLAHLFPKPEDVLSVAWDFDGDGIDDEKDGGIQSTFTYITPGIYTASAVVQLANKTQARYQREFEVIEPKPLPFPVTLTTIPSLLIGTTDFAVKFVATTEEPLHSVQWDFGDGETSDVNPSTHTYTSKGKWPVRVTLRSKSGAIAELHTLVKVVDALDLRDLRFEGPIPVNGNRIEGEAPLTVDLTPITQKSFVDFTWEASSASEVGSTQTHLQAIFRDPGQYTVTLVAKDAEDHVLRLPITVDVLPPSPYAEFIMIPASGVTTVNSEIKFDASGASYVPEDDEIIVYGWDFGDGNSDKLGVGGISHTYKTADTYVVTLRITTKKGLELTASHRVVVRSLGIQSRIFIPEALTNPDEPGKLLLPKDTAITFKGDSSEGSIVNYEWDFGDNVVNGGKDMKNATHVYTEPGEYTASLTVKDSAGKSDTAFVTLIVN